MDNKSFAIRVPKRWARFAMVALATAMVVAPLTAVASHTFNDVPSSHTFHGDIAWLEAAGVTKGCNPPANTNYCPDDEVTRGQMAGFMKRLAENQVVDAATVQGMTAAELKGQTGPPGPKGAPGNANVIMYTAGAWNTATNASVTISIPVSATVMNSSAWQVDLVRDSGNVYSVPGLGLNGDSDYRLYHYHAGGNAQFVIQRESGPGEEYASIRITQIAASDVLVAPASDVAMSATDSDSDE